MVMRRPKRLWKYLEDRDPSLDDREYGWERDRHNLVAQSLDNDAEWASWRKQVIRSLERKGLTEKYFSFVPHPD